MMKLYLFLSLISFTHLYCQTYDLKVQYFASGAGCHAASYNWDFEGDRNFIDAFSSGGNSMNVSGTRTHTVPNYSKFKLYLNTYCNELGASRGCEIDDDYELTNVQLIQGGYMSLSGCNGNVTIISFKPNVTIKNLDTTTPSEICSGFQLELAAFPSGFPNEAYHWQYSVNNQATWIDIPLNINGKQTNNIPTTAVYMQELLGNNHLDHIDKQIYFRLGYGASNNFTNPLPIKYSACAPTIKNIDYVGPKCNGDEIQSLTVTFNRPLSTTESFDIIKMKDAANGLERNERTNVPASALSETNTYSFSEIDALESGRTYKIVYQAKIQDPLDPSKTLLRGFMESTQTFTYVDPTALSFTITNDQKPSCFGGNDGFLEITINSGTSPFHFYLDEKEVEAEAADGKYYIKNLAAKENYSVMVTDAKGCIDKSADE